MLRLAPRRISLRSSHRAPLSPLLLLSRGYVTRGQMNRHLARLQELADTVKPAHERHQFERRGKVVCTIGPKIANKQDIAMLMESGMNVARFNFSHGEYSWFEEVISMIREVKKEKGRADVAIALDTKGPEIRTGQFKDGSPAGNPAHLIRCVWDLFSVSAACLYVVGIVARVTNWSLRARSLTA
jgi:hypothetical protein